jgi:hypothetical protein
LNESKGSAQLRQDQSDLQGVELNRLISLVSVEPHRGQRAESVSPMNRGPGGRGWQAPGGAMP